MIFIGDIAGEFDCLIRLIDKLPKGEEIVLLGDLNDRGPKSKEVIEWAMNAKNVTTLHSNHGHLMVDHIEKTKIYYHGCWFMNGGGATMRSYDHVVPVEHVEWLKTRSLYYLKNGILATHAPLDSGHTLDSALKIDLTNEDIIDDSLLWNRNKPIRREYYQVFGHNSHWGHIILKDEQGEFARCIDSSRKKILTAFHWPSKEVWEENY